MNIVLLSGAVIRSEEKKASNGKSYVKVDLLVENDLGGKDYFSFFVGPNKDGSRKKMDTYLKLAKGAIIELRATLVYKDKLIEGKKYKMMDYVINSSKILHWGNTPSKQTGSIEDEIDFDAIEVAEDSIF